MRTSRLKSSICLLLAISFGEVVQGQIDSALFKAFQYRSVGPTRGGRVTTVTGVDDQYGTFYMGASGGGVWKTTDYGVSWNNVSDGYFATASTGAIRVAKSNSDIVYVGTGSDGLRSNVITGKGVYKSADAGQSWSHIGLKEVGQIGAVEIHPENPDIVYVAAIGQAFQPNPERGVYKTIDGGKSWDKVLFHSDTVGAVDVEFAPDNPNTVYATLWRGERKPWTIISGGYQSGGIYKSTDGGKTWEKKQRGLPQGLIGKADLAVSAADPNRVYAIIEAPRPEGGLYRSDDRGESFRQISDRKELVNRPFYYTNVDVNPKNADMVMSNANPAMLSYDAGETWKKIEPPHGDHHDVWINPNDTSIWIQANDGGANVTTNSGKTWSTQFNQPTAELYQIEVDDQYPYWLYAGQQDNYTAIAVPSLPTYGVQKRTTGWLINVGGCETGPAVPKPGNPNIVYSDCKGKFGVYNKLTGQEKQYYVGATNIYGHNPKDLKYRFQRVAPIHVSPHDPNTVYHTSQFVHKTTDDGQTWEIISPDLTAFEPDKQVVPGTPITRDVTGEEYYSTIYSIRESTVSAGLIWVGSNDGPVHVTRNGGTNWENVTPNMPKGGRVDCVEPSPHQAGKAYISVLRYQLGDWKPYIYKTEDFGKNWALLTSGSNGIPADYPTRVVREDPNREGVLYAGTEFGLFISLDDGTNWSPFQQNLPNTPITDIKVYRNDLVLSTMGRGFWIMDNVTSLHQFDNTSNAEVYLFDPKDSYRYRYGRSFWKSAEIIKYPKAGVDIDYYLKNEPAGDVTLEILGPDNQLISRYNSSSADTEGGAVRDMSTELVSSTGQPGLTKNKGTNRFRWDMRYTGAWHSDAKKAYKNGPMVSPGTYTARLTVNGKQFEQTFDLMINPNLKKANVSLADIQEQEALAVKVNTMLDEARRLESQVKAKAKNSKNKKLLSLQADLSTEEGIYMTPKLVDQASYLLGMLNRADQKPGKDAYERYDELKGQFDELTKAFEKFK